MGVLRFAFLGHTDADMASNLYSLLACFKLSRELF